MKVQNVKKISHDKQLPFLPQIRGFISSRSGFTLIELLVVIGVLGILAAGLLAAIDPLEQLKKGRDTQKRNISVELHNALTRYYAVHGSMPWGTAATGPVSLGNITGTVINDLITVGELKPQFSQGLPGGAVNAITLVGASGGDAVFICFDPESKSISADPSTIFGSTGAPAPLVSTGTCPSATGLCYWCAR